jgi:pimeloyl-ACP methyl ester carboxylesterase
MAKDSIFQIKLDGKQLEVATTIEKRGPNWLLALHGLQSNKELFNPLFQQPFLSNHSLISMDFVGFGKSSKPIDFSYDIQDQANLVIELVRMLDIQNLEVVGHSLGGMVGTLLLNPLAGIIRSFVNMEGNLVSADCGLSKEVIDQPFDVFQGNNQFETIKTNIRNSQSAGSINRTKWVQDIPDFAFYKTCESIVHWSSTGELLKSFKAAQCKKLYMYGSKNKNKADVLSPEIARVEIPNAGHFMLQDNPEVCYRKLQDFYNDTANPSVF